MDEKEYLKGLGFHPSKTSKQSSPKTRKSPSEMTASEVNKAIESVKKKQSKINDQMIQSGRGHETAWDTVKLFRDGVRDPLTVSWNKIQDELSTLLREVHHRAGPGMHRLPPGRMFGPRKKDF